DARREGEARICRPGFIDVGGGIRVTGVCPSDVDSARGIDRDRRVLLNYVAGVVVHIDIRRPRPAEVRGLREIDVKPLRRAPRVPPHDVYVSVWSDRDRRLPLFGGHYIVVHADARIEAQPSVRRVRVVNIRPGDRAAAVRPDGVDEVRIHEIAGDVGFGLAPV